MKDSSLGYFPNCFEKAKGSVGVFFFFSFKSQIEKLHPIAYNVLRIADVANLEAQMFNLK